MNISRRQVKLGDKIVTGGKNKVHLTIKRVYRSASTDPRDTFRVGTGKGDVWIARMFGSTLHAII